MSLLIKYFGDFKITVITTESIRLYPGEVAEELKASSLCHRIRFIKSLFKWAQEEKCVRLTRYLPLKNLSQRVEFLSFLRKRKLIAS